MLFDLTSPGRKTAVRIIFGFLAFIFAAGFVFLGIGSEGGFNPFDNAGSGSTDEALEQQIEDAEKAVADAPGDPEPLASLIVLRFQSGQSQLDLDEETGATALTEESRQEFETAISLWQEYLDTDPKKLDPAAASFVVQAYIELEDIDGVIKTQQALAKSDPNFINLATLSNFLYNDLQIEEADKARDEALAAAKPEDDTQTVSKQLAAIRKQAVKAEKEQKKAPDTATGESPGLADPFGGLSPTDPGAETP